ncbi:Sporulation protein RMD1 [Lachnellula hyalina]|uniref:Sporulation protein RMD1 n=1 Tax=Lachnellula hyalina TaxID=1316788 RepID=A0A8H8U0I1_9HELO|nr:Sporulation protein RMD1 [Lachnellula hyalina]TVY26947.1 Sporulation protein RMD1 [Lachnellula hyalina]
MASTSTSTSTTTESTPLIHKKAVTFNPNPSVMGADGTTSRQPLSALPDSPQLHPPKPKRRNSYGAPHTLPNIPASKIGPQRTTKNAQKLKILPNPDFGDDGPDEESGRDVYSQYTRIKDPTARRDAARLGKADRDTLPRVTAYCTANTYRMDPLELFLKSKRSKARGAKPKQIDECIYTPYNYGRPISERALEVQSMPVSLGERRHSDSAIEDTVSHPREDLIDLHTQGGDTSLSNGLEDEPRMHSDMISTHTANAAVLSSDNIDFDTQIHTPEVFVFDYGVVVIWGMTLEHERRFLEDIQRYAVDKLLKDDREEECFNFYYTREYQARIYNDFITLRDKSNYMTKLAISHALAQSVKTSLFEAMVDSTIEKNKDIPEEIAQTGAISYTRTEINQQIGELFNLRINIHLNGSILDTPELFWVEPQLEPVYQAVRSYLEMDQRVSLLNGRLDVIADLLAVLKDQLSHGHGEKLEWIVIVLIAAEILVAAVNIVVDLYAGVD